MQRLEEIEKAHREYGQQNNATASSHKNRANDKLATTEEHRGSAVHGRKKTSGGIYNVRRSLFGHNGKSVLSFQALLAPKKRFRLLRRPCKYLLEVLRRLMRGPNPCARKKRRIPLLRQEDKHQRIREHIKLGDPITLTMRMRCLH